MVVVGDGELNGSVVCTLTIEDSVLFFEVVVSSGEAERFKRNKQTSTVYHSTVMTFGQTLIAIKCWHLHTTIDYLSAVV